MDRIRTVLRVLLPAVVIVLGIFVAKALLDSYEPPQPMEIEVQPPLVTAVPAKRVDLTLVVEAEGTVAPRTESQLVPEISGRVVEVSPSLAAGGFFAEGELLLRFEARVYELAVTRARASIEQARLRLITERADADLARNEWDAVGVGTPSPLLFREPQIAEAESSLAAAQATLDQAEYDLERTVLRAPFAGRVRSKQVDVGQFVQRGMTLATIYSVDVAEVRLPIPNAELEFCTLPLAYRDGSSTSTGPAVRLTARFAGRDHAWRGRIVRTEGEIDPRTRMVNAVAQVDDPYARGRDSGRPPLAVGMFVRAEIQGNRVRGVVPLPRSALRAENTVYVVSARNRLDIRPVEVLRLERDTVLVRSGLEDGELVCLSPIEAAVHGMRVDVADSLGGSGASAAVGAGS